MLSEGAVLNLKVTASVSLFADICAVSTSLTEGWVYYTAVVW